MTREVVTRSRVWPLGEPKPVPSRRDRWPRSAVVLHGRRGFDGATEEAVLLQLAAGSVTAEHLVHAGPLPSGQMAAYAAEYRARTVPGASRRIGLMDVAGASRKLRTEGHRRGQAIVGVHLESQLVGQAETWSDSTGRPGALSIGLVGLGSPYHGRAYKAFRDAPRVLIASVGDHLLFGWSRTRGEKPPDGRRRRPPPRRGPFVDVLQLAAALGGIDAVDDVETALTMFGLEPVDLGNHPLDRLRAAAHNVVALYLAELVEVRRLELGLDPSTLISTGGVATALFREAGVPRFAGRLDLPDDVAGAAASAFFGGWSAAPVVHVPVPAVQGDVAGTFPRCASAAGVQDFLVAEGVEIDDSMGWAPEVLAELADGARPLDRPALRQVARTLLRMVPDGHLLPVKVVRDGEARLAIAPVTDPDGCWGWAADVLAGAILSGGRLPPIVEALNFRPVGVLKGLRPVRLPSGRMVDLLEDDLALALLADRAAIGADEGLPEWRRLLLDGLVKRMSVAAFFGNLARIDRERTFGTVLDQSIGPDGERLSVLHGVIERPGPYASLALAGMVTAMARLVVAETIAGLEAAGGTWLSLKVDSLLIAATHAAEPELIPCPGGPIAVGRNRFLQALPLSTIEGVLDRTDSLLCPEGGHAWKREAGWDRR